jgi:hypothetical protein
MPGGKEVVQDLLCGPSEGSAAIADLEPAGLVAVVALDDPVTLKHNRVAAFVFFIGGTWPLALA